MWRGYTLSSKELYAMTFIYSKKRTRHLAIPLNQIPKQKTVYTVGQELEFIECRNENMWSGFNQDDPSQIELYVYLDASNCACGVLLPISNLFVVKGKRYLY